MTGRATAALCIALGLCACSDDLSVGKIPNGSCTAGARRIPVELPTWAFDVEARLTLWGSGNRLLSLAGRFSEDTQALHGFVTSLSTGKTSAAWSVELSSNARPRAARHADGWEVLLQDGEQWSRLRALEGGTVAVDPLGELFPFATHRWGIVATPGGFAALGYTPRNPTARIALVEGDRIERIELPLPSTSSVSHLQLAGDPSSTSLYVYALETTEENTRHWTVVDTASPTSDPRWQPVMKTEVDATDVARLSWTPSGPALVAIEPDADGTSEARVRFARGGLDGRVESEWQEPIGYEQGRAFVVGGPSRQSLVMALDPGDTRHGVSLVHAPMAEAGGLGDVELLQEVPLDRPQALSVWNTDTGSGAVAVRFGGSRIYELCRGEP